jgi:tRNA pseudouridine38-40 synthase
VPRFKLTIAYDGTNFRGWQKQEPYVSDAYPAPVAAQGVGNPDAYAMIQGVVHREGETQPRVQLRTVQHVVERTVREIVRERVNLMGASRTDSGVHARGQVAAFTCGDGETSDEVTEGRTDEVEEPRPSDAPTPLPPSDTPSLGHSVTSSLPPSLTPPRGGGWPLSRGVNRLKRAINGRLPDDVQITRVEVVRDDFNPISDCVSKGYSYTWHISPPPPRGLAMRPLWDRHFVDHVWDAIELEPMREAAKRIIGEHDFEAFAAASHGRETTVRTVFSLDITDLGEVRVGGPESPAGARRVRMDISGSGFLYNMVRIIAGTLIEVGKGRMTADDVADAIESKDRRKAGPTLPGHGLCLEWVKYGERP